MIKIKQCKKIDGGIEMLENGHKFELEDGYKYILEETNYVGKYAEEDIQEAIGDFQDEMCENVDEVEYRKFCYEGECLSLDSIALSAENQEDNVVMDGIAMFVGGLNVVGVFAQHIKGPYGIFIPYYNFSKTEVIFDAEGNKLTELDKQNLIEASKGLKEAINKLPYKNLEELMQRYTNIDKKDFLESEIGRGLENDMSLDLEKREEAYSEINQRMNEKKQQKYNKEL